MGGNLSERIVEWSVPFRGRSMTGQAIQRAGGLYLFEWNGRPVSGFRFRTGNASGSVSPLGVPSSPSFHLTAACARRNRACCGSVRSGRATTLFRLRGSAVFALDADPAAYPESSAGADRRVFDQSQAGFEDEFVGFSRAVVPGGQAGARTHRASRTASLRDCESPDAAVRSQTPP